MQLAMHGAGVAHVATSNLAQELGDRLPVSVITAHEPVTGNLWISDRWRVLGVVAGSGLEAAKERRTLLRTGPEGEQYLWSALSIELRKSDVESYYYNLVGGNPSVYVYCRHDDSGELVPQQITLEYIDAMAHQESGNETFSVPMPPEVYKRVEQFVLDHYVPEEPRMKRKHDDERSRHYEPED
jgi:hypothetical protein